ncbi:MAG: EAL domain-containing protein [Gammaproteobacteria bacterium]
MRRNERFILAVQLHDPAHFQQIFGSAVVQLAHVDLTRGIDRLCKSLLKRYRCFGGIVSPVFGRWYRVIGVNDSVISVDMDEQIPVLQEIGAAGFRELLIGCFGQATGSRLDFNFWIIPAPGTIDHESIEQAIDRAVKSSSGPCSLTFAIPGEAIRALIEGGGLLSYFQPIVSLADETVVGYEALTRGPLETRWHQADPLFCSARQSGLTEELELACLKQAIRWLAYVPPPLWISVNLGPGLLTSPQFRRYLEEPAVKPLLPRIVFELTEHLPVDSAVRLHSNVSGLLGGGMRLSLDDTGCGFFDLTTVEELEPEIVKLCITVVSRIGRGPEVEQEIRSTIQEVSRLGGWVLGEGVEHRYQAEALKQYGAALAQGNYFGKPRLANELFLPRG